MLRATMTKPEHIAFEDVPVPQFGDSDVLLRILRIGICGSDLHVFHGKHPYTLYPVVQGHEFSAEVAAVGKAVQGFRIGDLVTAPPQVVCGTCVLCRHGQSHICERLRVIGFQAPGVAQEFFVFPAAQLLQLPRGFTPEIGALVEPAAVAVHALRRVGNAKGSRVLVLGAGPIGNLVAQVANWRGAGLVAIADLSEFRLEIARRCGIQETIQVGVQDLTAEVKRIFGGDGIDVVAECVGTEATANDAIRVARKGSTVLIVGVFGEKPRLDLGLVQDRELHLVGSLMYQRGDYIDAIRCLYERGIEIGPLVTCSFPFRQYLDAYRHIEKNRERVMKVMIEVNCGGSSRD